MLILAFDCTMAACSVAVWRDGMTLAQAHEAMAQGQAEALTPMIAGCMAEANVAFDALDRVAITIGPGSFTGVRVGLAAARGFGLACKIPVVGATTGEVLARGAAREGTVISLVDTKRDDFYVEAFTADGARLIAAEILAPGDVAAWIARQGWPAPFTIVGDGAMAVAGDDRVTLSDRRLPDPAFLAAIAATREPDAAGPLPAYVRPPAVTLPA